MADISATDVKALTRALNEIDKDLKTQMVRDIKGTAKGLQTDIKRAIPTVSPLRGANTNGRLGWGQGKRANTVTINYKSTGSTTKTVTPLLKLTVQSPLTAVLDMAGRGSGTPRRNMTRDYQVNGRTRRHRVTTQGRGLINKMNQKGRPSRYAWSTVEDKLPQVAREVQAILDKASQKISRKFK